MTALTAAWILALSLGSAAPDSGPVQPADLGETAPPGLWSTDGGSPARTGASSAAPPRGVPALRWERPLAGEVVGEPRLFADLVIVEVLDGPGLRSLHVLDAASGEPRFPAYAVRSAVPLAPAVVEGAVVLRRGERELEAVDVQGRTLTRIWKYESKVAVSAPLAVGHEVYVCAEDALVRVDLGRRRPIWTVPGRFRGVPSVLGDRVYAVRYDERGRARLDERARADGSLVAEVEVGEHGGAVPPPGPRPWITITREEAYVHHALGVPTASGVPAPAAWVDLTRRPLGGSPAALYGAEGPTATAGPGRVGMFRSAERGLVLAVREARRPDELRVLAGADLHAEFVDEPPPPSAARGVLLLGRWGVGAGDGRILWELPEGARGRAVPTPGGFLSVRDGRVLEAWGTGADGAVEREVGRVLAGLRAALADRTLDLAREALRTRDADLSAALVGAARARGARAEELARLDRDLQLLRSQRAVQTHRSQAAEVARHARELESFVADGLAAAARASRDADLQTRLVEEVLRRAPGHPEGLALVREALPPGAEPPALLEDGLEWLELARLARAYGVRAVDPEAEGPAAAALADARRRWRGDLVGFATEHVVVLTPARRPGAVARCLATGELVCRFLSESFGGEPGSPDGPLVVHLYATRDEYLQRGGAASGESLEWTAGHYDPEARVSRLHLPGEAAEQRSVFATLAHELTHHWLDAHLTPGPADAAQPPHAGDPGFWVVEGLASMVEDFTFDLEERTWTADPGRSHRLDLLRSVPGDASPRWEELPRLSREDFARLSPKGRLAVPSRWYLGRREELSLRSIFYLRAAALAWGLQLGTASDRQTLLRAARDYYEGRGHARSVRAPALVARSLGL